MEHYKKYLKKANKKEKKKLSELKKSLKNSNQSKILAQYIKQHQKVLQATNKQIEYYLKDFQMKWFEFYSANMGYLIPEIPEERHFELYFETLKWRLITYTQVFDPSMLKGFHNFNSDSSEIDPEEPAIYVTYKYGSNQSVIGYLVANNIKLVLLMDDIAYKQKEYFSELIKKTQEAFGKDIPYKIINAEDKKAILEIISCLKNGYSALTFLDANGGVGGVYNDKAKLSKIKFLSGELAVRQGIPSLSHVTKTPVIPIVCTFNKDLKQPKFEIGSPISPQEEEDKNEFNIKTIEKLWKILEDKVKQNPAQWDGWERVHRFFDLDNVPEKITNGNILNYNSKYLLNRELYRVFKLGENPFLFNRQTYKTYKIEDELFNLLVNTKAKKMKKMIYRGVESSLLKELIYKEVLIEA